MFAVIKTGGLHYRVVEDQVLKVGKIKGDPGEIVTLGEVVVLGGDKPQLGAPTVSGASVAAEVIEQGRGRKVIAFKKRRRKNSRRKRGHRQEFTLIRISEILADGKKPSKGARAKPEPKPRAEKAEGAAKAAKKPKTVAKKPAAKAKAKAKGKGKSK